MICCLLPEHARPEWMGSAGQKSMTTIPIVLLYDGFFPFSIAVIYTCFKEIALSLVGWHLGNWSSQAWHAVSIFSLGWQGSSFPRVTALS